VLIGDVLGALDCISVIEAGVGHGVFQPVADMEGERAGASARHFRLLPGQGEAGDFYLQLIGEAGGGLAITAAYVCEAVSWRRCELPSNQIRQGVGRLLDTLSAAAPQAVMDVLAPYLAIDVVELVIMAGDVGAALRGVRFDHREKWSTPSSRRPKRRFMRSAV
jgi:hypothetical protein